MVTMSLSSTNVIFGTALTVENISRSFYKPPPNDNADE